MICQAIIEGKVQSKKHTKTRGGTPMVSLIVLNSRKYMNSKDVPVEICSWHPVQCIDDLMPTADKLEIGDNIRAEGFISHRKREDGPQAGSFVYNILATKIAKL